MRGFLVDEDLPRSLVKALRAAGSHAEDVRDVGLRGHTDDGILAHATSQHLVLLTADLGFGNILRFPLGTHAGVVLARLPNEMLPPQLNDRILMAVRGLSDQHISGNLIIIEPDRVRLRRKAQRLT